LSAERRKTLRVELAMPVRVQGFEADGTTWNETTSTADVSAGGVSFHLERGVALGQVLLLVLPLPARLRQYDLTEASYQVYSLVRGIYKRYERPHIGVMFFGKFPPRGFAEHPGARFLLPSDPQAGTLTGAAHSALPSPEGDTRPPVAPSEPPAGSPPSLDSLVADAIQGAEAPAAASPSVPGAPGGRERRQHPRFTLFVNFTLQQVDEFGAVLKEELTVADSLGRGGAQFMTTLDFTTGDEVIVQEAGGGFATRAQIRAVTRGADGVGRLHVKFLDRVAPDRILQQR
jgi:hypothetical protein